jgi:D-aspartate ligase
MDKKVCALILGGHVNGYSIIQELHGEGIREIVLIDSEKRAAAYSNKIKRFVKINNSPDNLYSALIDLSKDYSHIIIFPTSDIHIENLHKIFDLINSFCFVPFNKDNILENSNKLAQYAMCERIGVPYPKTIHIGNAKDFSNLNLLTYPIIIKPNKRSGLNPDVFRNIVIEDFSKIGHAVDTMSRYFSKGTTFIASEIIPGDGTNIYAYVGYRSKKGKIINEWTGKKLSQHPNEFGVFASASNQAPLEILQYGRELLNSMDVYGIAEPEFKYDNRDNKYKLMEINFRSMMWHRIGSVTGVKVQYSQYLDAQGYQVSKYDQKKDEDIHFVYLRHEFSNLMRRKSYMSTFIRNIFKSDRTYFAFFSMNDPLPFFMDAMNIVLDTVKARISRND